MSEKENENPPIRIPTDEEGVPVLAEEGEEEDGMTDQQRKNIAEAQARLRGF
jgi:hypothetical protein